MGYDCGFDISPTLNSSEEDRVSWTRFLKSIQEHYVADLKVVSKSGYYEFEVGEHPKLPRDGTKLLTFSSKVSGGLTREAEPYVRNVYNLAKDVLGDRIKWWHEACDDYSQYSWKDIHAAIREYGSDERTPWSDDEALNALRKAVEEAHDDSNDDGDDDDDHQIDVDLFGRRGGLRDSEEEDFEREESPRDLSACDNECGYCGHCLPGA